MLDRGVPSKKCDKEACIKQKCYSYFFFFYKKKYYYNLIQYIKHNIAFVGNVNFIELKLYYTMKKISKNLLIIKVHIKI